MPIRAISTGWGVTADKISSVCKKVDADSRVPNIEELKSLYYNKTLVNLEGIWHWSSTKVDANNLYTLQMDGPIEIRGGTVTNGVTKCIKR